MATVSKKKTADNAAGTPAEAPGAVKVEQDPATTKTAVTAAQSGAGAAKVPEYTTFVYCGPTLPAGRLKENTVLQGTLAEIYRYYADVLEKYPQIKTLIVPVNRLGAFAAKVKTPGNIANKYYNDIASAMYGSKEE